MTTVQNQWKNFFFLNLEIVFMLLLPNSCWLLESDNQIWDYLIQVMSS